MYESTAPTYSVSASYCDGRLLGSVGRLLRLWTGECLDTGGKVTGEEEWFGATLGCIGPESLLGAVLSNFGEGRFKTVNNPVKVRFF